MKNNKTKAVFMLMIALCIVLFSSVQAYAAPSTVDIPQVNISLGDGSGTPQSYVSNIKIIIFFTIISLLPSIVIMMTSFTRIIIVFSFLKTALGVANAIPAKILTGLALILTLFIMTPVFNEVNTNAIQPYLSETITQEEAIEEGSKPIRTFLLKQTRPKDLELFVDMAKLDKDQVTKDNVPFTTLIPAFAISELKTAFTMGFLIYLPFIVLDMVIASILMSMGMMMLPPAMISLPFKLLLFVMVDGWYLLTKTLVLGFGFS